jgi:hypothetical protein
MKQFFRNIFAHPKTTLTGIVLGSAQLAVEAGRLGLHAGHVGNSDVISLAAAVGSILLGAFAKDSGKQ